MTVHGRTASNCRPTNNPLAFRLFGHIESVVDLDAEISDSTLELCMTEQQLHGPEVFSTAEISEAFARRTVCAP